MGKPRAPYDPTLEPRRAYRREQAKRLKQKHQQELLHYHMLQIIRLAQQDNQQALEKYIMTYFRLRGKPSRQQTSDEV